MLSSNTYTRYFPTQPVNTSLEVETKTHMKLVKPEHVIFGMEVIPRTIITKVSRK